MASYRCTGWVWREITGWSSRLQEKFTHCFRGICGIYLVLMKKSPENSQHVLPMWVPPAPPMPPSPCVQKEEYGKNHNMYELVKHYARSYLRSVGSRPFHVFFTARSSYPHLRENSSSLGNNMIIPGQNYKYSSWRHVRYSQDNWWS